MLALDAATVSRLPVDQLGIEILRDLISTKEWNEHNYLILAGKSFHGEALGAIAEAMAWLRARALIARKPGQSAADAIMVTRTGQRVAQEGLQSFVASERLQSGIHPAIERVARPQFLIGQYELGVFGSLKAVEVRVRRIGGFDDKLIGVDLMNRAFGASGSLRDTTSAPGEQEGTRALFAGAYAVFRNPSAHREISYDDVSEAAEAVITASLLMRMLDRIEARLNETTT